MTGSLLAAKLQAAAAEFDSELAGYRLLLATMAPEDDRSTLKKGIAAMGKEVSALKLRAVAAAQREAIEKLTVGLEGMPPGPKRSLKGGALGVLQLKQKAAVELAEAARAEADEAAFSVGASTLLGRHSVDHDGDRDPDWKIPGLPAAPDPTTLRQLAATLPPSLRGSVTAMRSNTP